MECPQTEAYGHVTAEPSSGIPRTAADTWHRELGPRYTINPGGTPDAPEPSERRTRKQKGPRKREVGGWEENTGRHHVGRHGGRWRRARWAVSVGAATQLEETRIDHHKFAPMERTEVRELKRSHSVNSLLLCVCVGHGQRRQHLETVRDGGSLLPLSLGHARRAARGGSQALESCRPAALAAARCGASVDFTHTHTHNSRGLYTRVPRHV